MDILKGSREKIKNNKDSKQKRNTESIKITEMEVYSQIARVKLKKSSGEDGIWNEAWKNSAENIIDVITEIFNKMCEEGFPDIWKLGIIQPLYKEKELILGTREG